MPVAVHPKEFLLNQQNTFVITWDHSTGNIVDWDFDASHPFKWKLKSKGDDVQGALVLRGKPKRRNASGSATVGGDDGDLSITIEFDSGEPIDETFDDITYEDPLTVPPTQAGAYKNGATTRRKISKKKKAGPKKAASRKTSAKKSNAKKAAPKKNSASAVKRS
jgi:hypothetical protein